MTKLVILCSGGGGNLRCLESAIKKKILKENEIIQVFSDRDCGASRYAQSQGIPTSIEDFKLGNQKTLLEKLLYLQPGKIVSLIDRIIGPEIISVFPNKIFNLHYSLLPSFPRLIGIRPVEKAIEFGSKIIGVTVHTVIEEVDLGSPVVQAVCPVLPEDQLSDLMDVQFKLGVLSLLAALDQKTRSITNSVTLGQRSILINPQALSLEGFISEHNW